MKSRGIKDFYLPTLIAYHLKLLISSGLISFVFLLAMVGHFEKSIFISMMPMVFIQFEIFIWLGKKFFSWFPVSANNPPGLIISGTLIRLIVFYVMVLAIAFIVFLLSVFLQSIIHHSSTRILIQQFLENQSGRFFIAAGTGMLIGTLAFFYFQWQDSLKREQKLREEKLIFQYETLKNQVNPHFLFNSLNTLSSLVGTNPEAAETFIAKLSSTYRYVIENKDVDLVNLTEELKFTNEYFFLQKIRDGGKIDLKIDIFAPERYQIIPISLQILLENVFKHNAASIDLPLQVRISVNDIGQLVVSNPIRKKTILEKSTGIGLKNLGERIRLITGKELVITNAGDDFIVKIPLIPVKKIKG